MANDAENIYKKIKHLTLVSVSVCQEEERATEGGGTEWLGLEGKEVR